MKRDVPDCPVQRELRLVRVGNYFLLDYLAHGFVAKDAAKRKKEERGRGMGISFLSSGTLPTFLSRSGSDKGNIIGDVINHGKRQYWGRGGNYFYHCTLKKGENTLEAQIARLFLRSVASKGSYSIDGFREEFVTFMTTPGSHNDTYASTYIRMFFANQQKGLPLSQCPDNDSHNVDAMDAMTVIGPSVIWALGHGQDPTVQAEAYLQTLRKSKALVPFVRVYTEMIVGLIGAAETGTLSPAERLKGAASAAAKSLGVPLERAVREYRQQDPMVACYIDSAFPAMLVFVYKYAEEGFEAALLASANAGGENVARSSVLGTLFGLAYGYEAVAKTHPDLIQGLHEEEAIRTEIEAILV